MNKRPLWAPDKRVLPDEYYEELKDFSDEEDEKIKKVGDFLIIDDMEYIPSLNNPCALLLYDKGHHEIKIEYLSPLKKVGIVLSIVGLILFVGEVFMVSITSFIGSLFNEIKEPKTKLGKFIMKMYKKYKEVINYLIVGVLTTVVSLITKWALLFTVLDADNAFELQVAIILSWIISVLFAYVTNRIFVFCSKNKKIIKEMISFFGARVLTLVLEMVIMWFFVTFLKLSSNTWVMIWTIVSQVLVIILNYVFSKLFVFKKK